MKQLTDEARDAQFEAWWESSGQFCRSGGGAYEKTFAYTAWLAALDAAQPVPEVNAMLAEALDAALVYVAHMGHGTPQHMCPKGVTLFDADEVEVKLPDGRVVHAGRTPEYLRNKALTAAQQAQPVCGYDDTTGNCTRVNCCKQAQPEPLITYRHKDGNTRFEQSAKDPVPDWAVDVQPVKQAQPAFSGCACRWDADDKRVATCVRHQGWLDVVSEWAERAKAAESKQTQPALRAADHWFAEWELVIPEDARKAFKETVQQAKPEPADVQIGEDGNGQENHCPDCGAESGQICSSVEGVEWGRRVHVSRQQAQPERASNTKSSDQVWFAPC